MSSILASMVSMDSISDWHNEKVFALLLGVEAKYYVGSTANWESDFEFGSVLTVTTPSF